MLKLRGDLRLVPETPQGGGRGSLKHQLQSDVATESRVEGAIDDAHSASSQLSLDGVLAEL